LFAVKIFIHKSIPSPDRSGTYARALCVFSLGKRATGGSFLAVEKTRASIRGSEAEKAPG
jgi:hypothetical protein